MDKKLKLLLRELKKNDKLGKRRNKSGQKRNKRYNENQRKLLQDF